MGLDGDIQKLEESGDFFADGRVGPIYTGTIPLDRDEKLHPANPEDDDEPTEPVTVPGGDDVVVHVSMTAWMRSAFRSKTNEPGTDEKVAMVDVDQDEADDGDGKTLLLYSLDEIYASLSKYLNKKFYTTAQVRILFLAADKGKRIPREKNLTAKKRAARGFEPYGDDVTVTDNGIRQGSGGEEAKIHIHRLMQTRHLRKPLFEKMMERCLKDKTLYLKTLLWDVDEGPPVQMFRGTATKRIDLDFPRVGEDDISMPLHAFPQAQNIFCARDRDMKCIALLHRERMPKRCILDYGDGRYIPLHEFAKRLEDAGWTIDAYVQFCIFCGNDTFFKKWVAGGHSAVTIAAAFKALLNRGRHDVLDKRDFTLLLRLIYSHKAGRRDSVATSEDLRDDFAGYKKIKFPDEEVIHRAYLRFKWSFDYWNSLQGTLFHLQPIPEDCDIADIVDE